jgi:uracil-DNA glycosylase
VSEAPAPEEPHVLDELAGLAADLRTWLEVERSQAAIRAEGELPNHGLAPEVEPEPAPTPVPVRKPEPFVAAPPPPAKPQPAPTPPSPITTEPPPAPRPTLDAPPPVTADAPFRVEPDPPALSGLAAVEAELGLCFRCQLHKGRTNIVFGVGSESADVVFVGEGPGYHEDRQGIPFVGAAGELLTRIIDNVLRLPRDEVYICNVVKCRPPQNRDPEPDEVAACSPFLWKQLDVMEPAVVVPLGRFAVQCLLETTSSIGRLRGRVHPFRGISLVPTYHPAYLLRNPADKRKVLQDMLLVRQEYEKRTGRELPPVRSGKEARPR